MTSTELNYAEQRMQQKWHDLVAAEQQGASPQTLERMFNSYMLAVEDYNRRSTALTTPKPEPEPAPQHEEPAMPVPSAHPQQTQQKTSRAADHRRKAS